MQIKLSISDILEKKEAIQSYRRMIGKHEWKVRNNINPNGLGEDVWMEFYEEFKLFLPALTKEDMRRILKEWRKDALRQLRTHGKIK